MSVKFRLTLLSTLWLLLILVFLNYFIYTYFEKITTQSEIQLLLNKADTISQKDPIHQVQIWQDPSLLSEFLIYNEMLRIVDRENIIRNQVYSNKELLQIPSEFTTTVKTAVLEMDGYRSIMIRVPIMQGQKVMGTLEIAKQLVTLDYYGDILVTGLFIASGIAILLSFIGGYLYIEFVFRPVNRLADTMQKIEKSGSFRRLPLKKEVLIDELDKLGFIFNSMIGRLEKNFHQQQQFLADASHELRTPLTIIESYASLLKRWASNDPELREEAIEAIHSESIRLKGLVKSLLILGEGQESYLHIEKFSFLPVLQSTILSLQQTYGRAIVMKTQQAEIWLEADVEKIKQLLIILLDNAIKYSDKKVDMAVREEEGYIFLSVEDYGIGIQQEKIPFLFERFYRVDQARNRKTGGAGLGLSIAKRIVEQHEGVIEIESEFQVGTKIHVKIPKQKNG